MILGLDPGLSGAIALYDPASGVPVQIEDMPLFSVQRNAKTKREINVSELARLIDVMAGAGTIKKATVELVGALPQQGVSSTFAFGKAFGLALGILAAHFIPVQLVTPALWKKKLKLTSSKDASRHMATQLWPSLSASFARVKDDGRAEAALLAYYGAQYHD